MLFEERVQLEPFFEQAAKRRNEGLMLKDANSLYLPGKRGMSWLKWKKALATLDVVVTGVEFGHGRRRDVLSDYTFAVQHDGQLLNIGKGIFRADGHGDRRDDRVFQAHTMQDYGRFRTVEPNVVIEVAFNGIQKSDRHASGYALRFPRIVRIRTDKTRCRHRHDRNRRKNLPPARRRLRNGLPITQRKGAGSRKAQDGSLEAQENRARLVTLVASVFRSIFRSCMTCVQPGRQLPVVKRFLFALLCSVAR